MRLTDLDTITSKNWSSPHQWRSRNGKIEFGLDSTYGLQWFCYTRAPVKVTELVIAYKKMSCDN